MQLLVVNKKEKIVGYRSRKECHQPPGTLHRAFSIFVFDSRGRLLIQKRSRQKFLWPGIWSNSCCSHPTKGQDIPKSVQLRLKQELGFSCPLKQIGKVRYQACWQDKGCEKEITYVYFGSFSGLVKPNPREISQIKWITLEQLKEETSRKPKDFSPWFKLIIKKFQPQLLKFSNYKFNDNPDEVFEQVDKNGKVIGKITRLQAHSNPKLIHQVVHLLVYDGKGRILLQKRSHSKDLYPGLWTVSASGHLDPVESFRLAALREAEEELGICLKQGKIKYLGKILVRGKKESELIGVFSTTYDNKFSKNYQEVSKLQWFSQKNIWQGIEQGDLKLTPMARAVLTDKNFKKKIFWQLWKK